jgi:cell division protein FtsZ
VNKIKIVGVGGAGSNIVSFMILKGLSEAQLIVMNTDEDSLKANVCANKVLLKTDELINNSLLGRKSAYASQEKIKDILYDGKVLILIAGLGGNTATSALPVIVEIARDLGMYVVCMVTTPFAIETEEKRLCSFKSIIDLESVADNVVVFDNENFKNRLPEKATFKNIFEEVNYKFLDGVRYIINLFRSEVMSVDEIRMKQISKVIAAHDFDW